MNSIPKVTVAICCYNAAEYLPKLLMQLVKQSGPLPWEILFVDNNSSDASISIINDFAKTSKIPIRTVQESEQGIPHARNRAIEESRDSTFLAFIDADELPDKNWLTTAIESLQSHSADCVGGEIDLDLSQRPAWLCDSMLPFLGKVKYGDSAFQIHDKSTPIWSGNIAYRLSIFKGVVPFDARYNRKGKGIGGGSDGVLFGKLLKSDCVMLYEPEMRIIHHIPPDKLTRSYFVRLHFVAGKKSGLYEIEIMEERKVLGIPRYMFLLLGKKILVALKLFITDQPDYMREAMKASHQLGQIVGISQRYNTENSK